MPSDTTEFSFVDAYSSELAEDFVMDQRPDISKDTLDSLLGERYPHITAHIERSERLHRLPVASVISR